MPVFVVSMYKVPRVAGDVALLEYVVCATSEHEAVTNVTSIKVVPDTRDHWDFTHTHYMASEKVAYTYMVRQMLLGEWFTVKCRGM